MQIWPLEFEDVLFISGQTKKQCTKALFILKWGGEITHAGINQAEDLGR